nr:hypothetical protein [Tanacetum cinerariifolium]
MDSIIPLGQKNTFTEYMILFGADNRPPMLDKDLLPPKWSKFVTDVKLVKDFHTTNYDQLHAYLKQHELHANEVRLLRLSVPVFSPGDDPITCLNKTMAFLTAVASSRFPSINNQLRTSSNLRNQTTIQDGRETKQLFKMAESQCNKFRGDKGKFILVLVIRVMLLVLEETMQLDRQGLLNATTVKKYEELTDAEKLQDDYDVKATNIVLQGLPLKVYSLVKSTITMFLWNATWYKDKAMLAEAQEAGQILDEKLLTFLADPGVLNGQAIQTIIPNNVAFQTEDLDTYDSNYDDISNVKSVLMANISNYGFEVILKVPHSETYLNDMENKSVHAMQDFEQLSVVDFPYNKIHSDNNIIPGIFKIFPRVQGQDFVALPTDEEFVSFLRELRHTREINSLNDVVVDHMHQLWRNFAALINKSLSRKTTGLEKLRLSRAKSFGTYLGFATEATPPKKAPKFKKPASSKLTTVPVSTEAPTGKSKRIKRPAKKSTKIPARDDSNNEQVSSDEDSDQEKDSDDDKTQSDNEHESNTEHETDESESGSESDHNESKEN